MPNTRAISSSLLSVLFSPASVFTYTFGSTIRKLIQNDNRPEPNQISRSTTKDATGTDLNTAIIGASNSSAHVILYPAAPNSIPAKRARKNPNPIPASE